MYSALKFWHRCGRANRQTCMRDVKSQCLLELIFAFSPKDKRHKLHGPDG
eukprot:m.184962 g.184962  ORF g.184962 m.184962 type:complete len:50 (+) comp14725_c1_seq1:964-1113(+)